MPLNSSAMQSFNAAASRALRRTPKFVELDAEAIAKTATEYQADDIPAGAFRSAPAVPEEELSTLFFDHLLIGRSTLEDPVAAALVRELFDSKVALQSAVPAARFIQAPKTEKDATIPIHPGAAAYLDGSEKSFFDRHGDALFYGSMLVSMFGTAALALYRSVVQKRSAALPDSVSRLWALARAAGRADSLAELERLEAELFTEFDRVVQAFAQHRITEGDLSAAAAVFGQTVSLARDRARMCATEPPAVDTAPRDPRTAVAGRSVRVPEIAPASGSAT
jgi:hypothetical protein